MARNDLLKNERGSAWAWIFTIFLLIVVGVGAYLTLIRFGMVEAPEALASMPGMSMFLPPQEEVEEGQPVAGTAEDILRMQNIQLIGERDTALARITALEQQLEEMQQLVKDREGEITLLQGALSLARDQNINNVALIFENMDPEDASIILSNLGAQKASLILSAMRESKAADVLALMDDTLATEITRIMAGLDRETPQATTPESSSDTGTRQPAAETPRVPTPSGGTGTPGS